MIELIDIAEELTRLWDEEQGKDKIRACLFNLIIYTQKAHRDVYYRELVKTVICKFPCRVFLITGDDAAKEPYLKTLVSTETIGEGELQIFCEIIEVQAGGPLRERIPFIILPHILPDLPIYLLWTQDPSTENTVLPRLESFAQRVIFDPEAAVDLQKFAKAVLALKKTFSCEVSDLNWSALAGWRNIMINAFNTQESLLELAAAKRITIHFKKDLSQRHEHSEMRAAYLQGWLAAQFQWEFVGIEYHEGNMRLSYKRPTQEISVVLIPEEQQDLPPSLPTGAILSLEIESARNKAHHTFKRHPDTRQVFIQYSNQDRCDLPYCTYLPGVQEGQEIIEEIFYHKTGVHYEKMQQVVAQIPWSCTELK